MKQTTLINISNCSLKYKEINVEMRKFSVLPRNTSFDKQKKKKKKKDKCYDEKLILYKILEHTHTSSFFNTKVTNLNKNKIEQKSWIRFYQYQQVDNISTLSS